MTRVPYLLERARLGYRLGNAPLTDGMYKDGFLDPICGMLMGETAEKLGRPLRHPARGAGRLRAGEPAEGGSGDRGEPVRGRDRPRRGRRPEGGDPLGDEGRASAARDDDGGDREAPAGLPDGRHGARREFLRNHRRRRGAGPGGRVGGPRALGLTPMAWVGASAVVGRRSHDHGHRPRARDAPLLERTKRDARGLSTWSS